MSSLLVRPFEPRDIGPVTSLVRSLRAAADLGADFGGLGVDVRGAGRGAPAREGDGPPSETWVVEIEGQAVGVAAVVGLDDETCELRRLYVEAEHQAAGAGTALVDEVRGWASERGFRRVLAQIPDGMGPARRFLVRRGFGSTSSAGEFVLDLPP